jgi:SSS family transporter
MHLPLLDLAIIATYIVGSLAMGLYFARRATRSFEEYFVAGRSLPWWLAGTSMIASSFAIDTPLGITGLVAKQGIQGVWFAWAYIIGGAGTFGAFIFASLLRRSNIITTAELIELRYSGRGAAILRGFKGVYFGVLAISISMGWVMRSVLVLAQQAFGWDALPTLTVIVLITIAYTTLSGFWGVAVTDFIQFFIGSFGSVALAYYAIHAVGGFEGLFAGLEQRYGVQETVERLQFVPRPQDAFFHTFLIFITLKWWGNPPAALNQRIMSTRDERHATFSQMLFTAVHFGVNYWPMIVAALVSLAIYPDLPAERAEQGYALMLVKVLPTGILGLALASATAAFMSTVDTQANTGASFMVNDIYRRFIRRNADRKHYVRASQVSTVIMLGLAVAMALMMSSVRAAWEYLATLTAGYNFVVVARWFWWRINAWSELAALAGSGIGSLLANHLLREELGSFGMRFAFVAAVSGVCWIAASLVTRPPSLEALARFCRAVKPYPLGWGPVRRAYPEIEWSPHFGRSVTMWAIGLIGVLALNFGSGHLLLGSTAAALTLLSLAGCCLLLLLRYWRP